MPFNKKTLFMYFRVENAKSFLGNHSLKLSNLTKFNDPFETAIDYQKSLYTTGVKKYCERIEELNSKDITMLDNKLFSFFENVGVCCFTESDTDILMWAYYGENHKGICFEFDPDKDLSFFKDNLYKVNYKSKFGYIKKYEKNLFYDDIVCSKANCWEHEKEWRVAKENMADKIWPINPKAIRSIIFGCNMTDYRNTNENRLQDYKDIIELLKRPEYEHIKIKQIQKDSKEYKLHSNEVPFFTYVEQKDMVIIISFRDQDLYIEDENKNIIYNAKMCKWEQLELHLSEGIYYLHNSKDPIILLKILHENKI